MEGENRSWHTCDPDLEIEHRHLELALLKVRQDEAE